MAKQYFDVADIMKESPETMLYLIVGQGGVGKTYSAKFRCVDRFLRFKKKFIYIRNVTPEISASALSSTFSDVEEDKRLEWDLYDPEHKYYCFHILPKGAYFWLVGEDINGKLMWLEQFGRIVAISKAEAFKGGAYNDADTILYDEFISESKPHPRTKSGLSKIIGTVARKTNPDVKVICCGNPDYAIELNPLIEDLHIDYAHLQDNTAYYFDRRTEDGQILARNVCFFKVANYKGENFIDARASHLFNSAEELMRATGTVKTHRYIHADLTPFTPYYSLVVETPVLANDEYRKKIYIYYGKMYEEPVCVCCEHREYKDVPELFCRYEETDFRPRPMPQTFRINIPPQERFNDLRHMIALVDANRLIISNNDSTGTLFEQIRENS